MLTPAAVAACGTLDERSHGVLFAVLMAPIRAKFTAMPDTGAWAGSGLAATGSLEWTPVLDEDAEPDADADDLAYSVQPLPYITSVGEQLLLTVQLLGPIAKGDLRRTTHVRAAPVGVCTARVGVQCLVRCRLI